MDTPNPATAGEARRSTIMARKNYTDEFRRQAVDLYRSTAGADATSGGASHPGRTGGPGRRRGLSPEDELAGTVFTLGQFEMSTRILAGAAAVGAAATALDPRDPAVVSRP